MQKKSKYSLFVFTIPLLVFAVWFFFVCMKYKAVACGVIILFCVIMSNALVALMELRHEKIEEENLFEKTGNVIREVSCSMSATSANSTVDYTDGRLVFYEKGIDYMYDKDLPIGFVPYSNIGDIEVSDDKINISIFGSHSRKYIISSDKPLRIKNICSFLHKEGLLDDGKEE